MPTYLPAEDLRRLLRATTLPKRRVAHMGSVVRRKGLPPGSLPPVAIAAIPGSDAGGSGRDGGGSDITPRGSTPQFTPGNTPGAPHSLGEQAPGAAGWLAGWLAVGVLEGSLLLLPDCWAGALSLPIPSR